MKKAHKHILWVYGIGAALYYFQAQKAGLNPSAGTALAWPVWFLKSPSGVVDTWTGRAKPVA